MKNTRRASKKLVLATETLRDLADDRLTIAVGGQRATSGHFTCQLGCTNEYFCATTRTW